jgi:hypothetical protein
VDMLFLLGMNPTYPFICLSLFSRFLTEIQQLLNLEERHCPHVISWLENSHRVLKTSD